MESHREPAGAARFTSRASAGDNPFPCKQYRCRQATRFVAELFLRCFDAVLKFVWVEASAEELARYSIVVDRGAEYHSVGNLERSGGTGAGSSAGNSITGVDTEESLSSTSVC
jgi:hypothetical protein